MHEFRVEARENTMYLDRVFLDDKEVHCRSWVLEGDLDDEKGGVHYVTLSIPLKSIRIETTGPKSG